MKRTCSNNNNPYFAAITTSDDLEFPYDEASPGERAPPCSDVTNSLGSVLAGGSTKLLTDRRFDTSSVESSSIGSKTASRRTQRPLPCITYETVTWAVFLAFTSLAIIDRFVWNVWPRQTFRIGSGSAGTDQLEGLQPGPWSVKAYDIIARVSGRFCICCLNLLLLTRIRCFEHFLATSWVSRYVLDCSDIANANNRLHRWNAIALCVVTVIHVWSILFPCVTHGYGAKVIPGTFEYPLSERKPPGFKDANPQTEMMSLQVDDVWRMVEMTVMLCILTPLSVRWLATRWHIGLPLHQVIMVLYFVDIVRRHTHPHSWILNTPFFVLWLIDKGWQKYWRRCISPVVQRVKLGDDYMVLLWHSPTSSTPMDTVGPDYSMRLNNSSLLEGRHAFTGFENRLGFNLDSLDANVKWTTGTVIRVFHNKRVPRLGKKDPHSHTKRMYDAPTPLVDMTIWGPSLGEMSNHVKNALFRSDSVILVGAGSGVGYMIDALQYSLTHAPECRLTMLFTTRSQLLHKWTHQIIKEIVSSSFNYENRSCNNTSVVLALTGKDNESKPDEEDLALSDPNNTDERRCQGSSVRTIHGRIDFSAQVEAGSVVFCQGGAALKDCVAKVCRKGKARFFGGRGGS